MRGLVRSNSSRAPDGLKTHVEVFGIGYKAGLSTVPLDLPNTLFFLKDSPLPSKMSLPDLCLELEIDMYEFSPALSPSNFDRAPLLEEPICLGWGGGRAGKI